jgi:hypothetical protein
MRFVARRPVSCIEVDRDQYKRAIPVCTVAGTDLAEWLGKNGLRSTGPSIPDGSYAAAQPEAKRDNLGMWSGSFNAPWRYRACRRTAESPVGCSDQFDGPPALRNGQFTPRLVARVRRSDIAAAWSQFVTLQDAPTTS